jgi:hypothetical protein
MKAVYTNNINNSYPGYDQVLQITFGLDDGECSKFFIDEAHQNYGFGELGDSLAKLYKKVELGGTIIIRGVNADTLFDLELRKQIDIGALNQLCYNGAMRSIVNINNIVDLLTSYGARITKKRVEGVYYIVEAIREN